MSEEQLKDEISDLQKQVFAVREALYQVLKKIGEPVVVSFDQLNELRETDVEMIIQYSEKENSVTFWYEEL